VPRPEPPLDTPASDRRQPAVVRSHAYRGPPSVHWSQAGVLASLIKVRRPLHPNTAPPYASGRPKAATWSSTARPPLLRLPSPVGTSSSCSGTYQSSCSRVSFRPRPSFAGQRAATAGTGRRRRAPSPAPPPPRTPVKSGPSYPSTTPHPLPRPSRRRARRSLLHPRRPPPLGVTLRGESYF
jgi:hypothetical protein